ILRFVRDAMQELIIRYLLFTSHNEQSDDEFEEFDNEEFDPNQIAIYRATSIAESTDATKAFENLLVRSVS
ncbi:19589_t:CDS:2, partial [Cetraspora pellucida]